MQTEVKKEIIPVGWTVIVKIDKVAEKTRSGLFLPQGARERQQLQAIEGTLYAVGPEAWAKYDPESRRPEPGDRVLFAKYGGQVFKFDEDDPEADEFRILNDQDIICIIREG